MKPKVSDTQEARTSEIELREDLDPLASFELPPGLEGRVVATSLKAQVKEKAPWLRWLVAAACLSPIAAAGLYLAAGAFQSTTARPPLEALPSDAEAEAETFVIRNDGNLILLERGDQVVSIIGAER